MELKIIDRKPQALLSREKIRAEIGFNGPIPSRKEISKELSSKASVKPEMLVVFKIESSFGSKKAKVIAFAYTKKEDMDKIEEKKKFARTGFKSEVKEVPAEEAKE